MRLSVNALILCLCALTLTGCFGSDAWRQKLTLTVMTPDGEIEASSVTQVVVKYRPSFAGTGGDQWSVTGEGVVVSFGDGAHLISALRPQHWLLMKSMKAAGLETQKTVDDYLTAAQQQDAPVPVTFDNLPRLFTFEDVSKPETVKEVEPGNLSEVFGDGFELTGATIELTSEMVDHEKIRATLVWWDRYYDQKLRLSGEQKELHFFDDPLAVFLTANVFKTKDD